jgi:DNA-binding beta-propeller fold protein YncE
MSVPFRGALAFAFLFGIPAAFAAPAPRGPQPGGVFVLDDCDRNFHGQETYHDSLSYIDGSGKLVFRVSGFNIYGGAGGHMLAYDAARRHVWVAEYAGRILKFDLEGNELVRIDRYGPLSVAVDPASGNLWATLCGRKLTVVLDPAGKELAEYKAGGPDIAYDAKGKAFWLPGKELIKLSAADGKELVRKGLAGWDNRSLAVNPVTGRVWVTGCHHADVAGSKNELLGFDNDGRIEQTIDFGPGTPSQPAIDPKSGAVWVTDLGIGVRRYRADGKLEFERKVEALAAHVDSLSGELWVVTPEETIRMSRSGDVVKRIKREGRPTPLAWVAGS